MPIGTIAAGVKTKHKDFDIYAKKWERCRDAVSGQDAIYAKSVAYLPYLVGETPEEYSARQTRTPFYNATWRTIAAFIGMLYRKPPTIEVPEKLKPLLDDITMSGINFQAFAKDCTTEDLEVSRLGVLVDHPEQKLKPDGKPLNKLEYEQEGLRPFLKQYKAESIIDAVKGRYKNKTVYVQIRLLETETVPVAGGSEFQSEDKTRIRVLDLVDGVYRVRIFDEETETQVSDDIFPKINGKTLDYIPFYFIGPDGTDGTLDDPILIDLVDLNLKHFRVSADYEHGCHFCGLPTPWVSGYKVNPDFGTGNIPKVEFKIGSTVAWIFPDANAKAEYLEFTGTGLGELEKNLGKKEAQMAALGARLLAPEKSGVEAAETLAIKHSGENSILSAIAIAVSEGLTMALKTLARWAGVDDKDIKFEINREFIPVIANAQLLAQLMALVQSGNLDKESLFDWIKRADIVPNDLTYEEMQKRIDAEPPEMPTLGHNGGPPLNDNEEPPVDDPNENEPPEAA